MRRLKYSYKHKKRASTVLALGVSECEAAEKLIELQLFREAVVHLYFTCFYTTQALLADKLSTNPSHKNVESELHKIYGRNTQFPRTYVDLHSALHVQRNQFDYQTTHTPDPELLKQQLQKLKGYVNFALRYVPRVEIAEILSGFYEDNKTLIKDFSYDIYCPKTYAHHTRITFWQPPFYLSIFSVKNLSKHAIELLKLLKVRRHKDYVVGLNSKINQYKDDHLVMLDIDTVNPSIEAALKPIGGILIKSGRGFHFIGKKVIKGQRNWEREMRSLQRNPQLRQHLDMDHIDISLRRKYATLRVTASPVKPTIPFFYKEL